MNDPTGLQILGEISNVAVAAAALFASWLAWKGLSTWKRETVGRRRIELAEDTIADFYEARDIITAIRNPFSYGGEAEQREGRDEEKPEIQEYRDAYYIPLKRIDEHTDFFAKLRARRYRVIAAFGIETAEPFEKVYRIRSEIVVAARMLLVLGPEGKVETRRKHEASIWWSGEGDTIETALDEVIVQVENTFRPVIESA